MFDGLVKWALVSYFVKDCFGENLKTQFITVSSEDKFIIFGTFTLDLNIQSLAQSTDR